MKKMKLDLKKLNKKQREVVTFGKGPCLVVAGAGTGKTSVITHRAAYLIEKKKARPEEILTLTFSDKAAEEMEERIDRLLSYGYFDLWVSTFHAFCKRILDEHGLDIGISTDFKLLDQTSGWLLVRQNLNRFKLDYYKPLGNPTKFIHALLSHFSRCKDYGIYPEDYIEYAGKVKGEERKRIIEIGNAYKEYQNLLLENNLLDFGDLINYCLKLFKKRSLILEEYRKKFKYILVDEFQDTNWTQYELIKLLAAPKNNLTISADDDQAIYCFRGASFNNIIQFRKDFPKAKEIVLLNNYRSTQNILDLSHKFIQLNNPNRLECIDKINKRLISMKKNKGIIEHMHFKNLNQEVEGVISKIIDIFNKDKKSNFNDFAILVRANLSANPFVKALERAKLPYQFMALRGLYSKSVILDIISYFKLLDNYHESSAVYRILNLPFLKIPIQDISKITQYSTRKGQSIYESLQDVDFIPSIKKQTVKKVKFILDLIEKHSILANQKSVSMLFLAFIQDSGYIKYLVRLDDEQEFSYLNEFYNKIKKFEDSSLDPKLRNFMQEFNLEIESGEQGKLIFDINDGPEMIRIMTIHAAKGLEFKYVFLVSLVDKKFPSIIKKDQIEIPDSLIKEITSRGDIHLEEERRLFYVGMTRAKNGLFFSSADDYGGKRNKKISRFLIESGFNLKNDNVFKKGTKESIFKQESIKRRNKKINLKIPNYFSFTQLKAFDSCPLQYKLAHIIKIPRNGNAVFSYGKTIHNTLFEFVKEFHNKRLDFKNLIEIYKKEWIDDWYNNKDQRKEYFKLGKKSLKNFYKDFIKKENQTFSIDGKLALEQKFNFKIDKNSFIGKIDRINKIGKEIEIIDYKTGKFNGKLKKEDKEQLLIYQIVSEEIFKLKPKRLTYYYLDENKKVSFLGKEEEIKKERERIISLINKIKKSDFSADPGWQCKFCDFKNICEYAKK